MTAAERQTLRAAIDKRRRELVADDRPDPADDVGAVELPLTTDHGREGSYTRHGCRCSECTAAMTAGRRERRRAKRAADARRQRLLAACRSCADPEGQVRAVLRMLDTQARRISTAASADRLPGSMADAAEGVSHG